MSIKPGVLTTDLTLVPIYELVDDEGKRITLRDALDDLINGDLKVKLKLVFFSNKNSIVLCGMICHKHTNLKIIAVFSA